MVKRATVLRTLSVKFVEVKNLAVKLERSALLSQGVTRSDVRTVGSISDGYRTGLGQCKVSITAAVEGSEELKRQSNLRAARP